MARCKKRTEWGQCKQPRMEGDHWCRAHVAFRHRTNEPDRYWHEKLVKGLITPTSDWMTESELHAIINGRYRGDGRRIDQYITGDPLMIDTDGFR